MNKRGKKMEDKTQTEKRIEIKDKSKDFDELEHIKEVLNLFKEDDMDAMLDVATRVQKRLKVVHYDIIGSRSKKFPNGQWVTQAQKLHGTNLKSVISNGEGILSYQIYEKAENKRDKKYVKNMAKISDGYGKEKEIIASGEYPLRYMVVERFKPNKEIEIEITDLKKFGKNMQEQLDSGKIKI